MKITSAILLCFFLSACCHPIQKIDFDGTLMDEPKKLKKLDEKVETA